MALLFFKHSSLHISSLIGCEATHFVTCKSMVLRLIWLQEVRNRLEPLYRLQELDRRRSASFVPPLLRIPASILKSYETQAGMRD